MRKIEKACVDCEPGWARRCSSCDLVSEEITCDSCRGEAEYCWEECDYCPECLDKAIDSYWKSLKTDEKIKLLKEHYDATEMEAADITLENVDALWNTLESSEKIDVIDPYGTEIKEV